MALSAVVVVHIITACIIIVVVVVAVHVAVIAVMMVGIIVDHMHVVVVVHIRVGNAVRITDSQFSTRINANTNHADIEFGTAIEQELIGALRSSVWTVDFDRFALKGELIDIARTAGFQSELLVKLFELIVVTGVVWCRRTVWNVGEIIGSC